MRLQPMYIHERVLSWAVTWGTASRLPTTSASSLSSPWMASPVHLLSLPALSSWPSAPTPPSASPLRLLFPALSLATNLVPFKRLWSSMCRQMQAGSRAIVGLCKGEFRLGSRAQALSAGSAGTHLLSGQEPDPLSTVHITVYQLRPSSLLRLPPSQMACTTTTQERRWEPLIHAMQRSVGAFWGKTSLSQVGNLPRATPHGTADALVFAYLCICSPCQSRAFDCNVCDGQYTHAKYFCRSLRTHHYVPIDDIRDRADARGKKAPGVAQVTMARDR